MIRTFNWIIYNIVGWLHEYLWRPPLMRTVTISVALIALFGWARS